MDAKTITDKYSLLESNLKNNLKLLVCNRFQQKSVKDISTTATLITNTISLTLTKPTHILFYIGAYFTSNNKDYQANLNLYDNFNNNINIYGLGGVGIATLNTENNFFSGWNDTYLNSGTHNLGIALSTVKEVKTVNSSQTNTATLLILEVS